MNLSPREKDKLLISMAAIVARRRLERGVKLNYPEAIALISDAGTPLISDPGYSLVQQARAQGIAVIPIPGPCALITALSAAGVPCDNFSFFGFLPAKPKARREKLELVKQLGNTVIFYESTHRIHACIDDMSAIFGEDSPLVLAKELTKTFEQFVSGPLSSIKLWLNADLGHVKGEFVLIIPPRTLAPTTDSSTRILKLLLAELPLKQAVSLATEISGGNKNMLYQEALALTEQLKKHGGLD